MTLELVTLRDRPDLRPQLFTGPLRSVWPEFMMHDPIADLYFDPPHFEPRAGPAKDNFRDNLGDSSVPATRSLAYT